MKYGYKETRMMSSEDLRNLCIRQNWFTRGTNEEYDKLLAMTKKENITTDDIVEMATLIVEHSVEQFELFTTIMFYLAQICSTHFDEV